MAAALSPEEKEAKAAARSKAWYEANRGKALARDKVRREADKERISARVKAQREANKEIVSARNKEWYDTNKEEIAVRRKAHRDANPHLVIIRTRARRQKVAQQCPVWADQSKIAEIYRDAAEFRAAGLNVHVDHVVPLKAKLASGLHVHQNLTIKLAGWNDSKGNKYDPMEAAP